MALLAHAGKGGHEKICRNLWALRWCPVQRSGLLTCVDQRWLTRNGMHMQMKAVTILGAFLDPVADKIMVSATLVLLAVSPPAPLSHADLAVPVVIMIGREITMSSLREWAAACGGTAHRVSSPKCLVLACLL